MNDFLNVLIDALSGGWSAPLGSKEILMALLLASAVAVYIYLNYVFFTRRTFYSREFNVTLACVTIITAGLVAAIQTSLLVTLSVGGALSIIRFRTAIKNPIDLAFLFWSIAAGIMCGTGVGAYAMMLSLFLTAAIFLLSKVPFIMAPYILIINAKSDVDTEKIDEVLKKDCGSYAVRSRSLSGKYLDMTVEFRAKKDAPDIVGDLMAVRGVESASVLEHNGDASF